MNDHCRLFNHIFRGKIISLFTCGVKGGGIASVLQVLQWCRCFVQHQNVFTWLCFLHAVVCVCLLCCVYVPCVCVCVCVCVWVRKREREILRYLASLLPLFVWLQAFRLSARGLCSETKHAVISVTSLAAGIQHTHLSETRCYGTASLPLRILAPAVDT